MGRARTRTGIPRTSRRMIRKSIGSFALPEDGVVTYLFGEGVAFLIQLISAKGQGRCAGLIVICIDGYLLAQTAGFEEVACGQSKYHEGEQDCYEDFSCFHVQKDTRGKCKTSSRIFHIYKVLLISV
jgi:hypothetical protein